jgi:hypothetical protein
VPSGWKFWPEREPGPVDDAFVQSRWVRPYRPGPVRVLAAGVIGTFAVFTGFAGFLAMLAEPVAWARVVDLLVTVVVAGSLVVCCARLMSVGVWVNDFGVRILGLVRNEQIDWRKVTAVRRGHGPARVLGTPVRRPGDTVWIVLADGSDRETPLTDAGPDFLARAEAYDMAAGAVERWFEETKEQPA